jgi:hypothetical protein
VASRRPRSSRRPLIRRECDAPSHRTGDEAADASRAAAGPHRPVESGGQSGRSTDQDHPELRLAADDTGNAWVPLPFAVRQREQRHRANTATRYRSRKPKQAVTTTWLGTRASPPASRNLANARVLRGVGEAPFTCQHDPPQSRPRDAGRFVGQAAASRAKPRPRASTARHANGTRLS